jgi:hypothetical protein
LAPTEPALRKRSVDPTGFEPASATVARCRVSVTPRARRDSTGRIARKHVQLSHREQALPKREIGIALTGKGTSSTQPALSKGADFGGKSARLPAPGTCPFLFADSKRTYVPSPAELRERARLQPCRNSPQHLSFRPEQDHLLERMILRSGGTCFACLEHALSGVGGSDTLVRRQN